MKNNKATYKNNSDEPIDLLACSSMKLTSKTNRPYWFRTLDYKTNIWDAGAHLVSIPKGHAIKYTNNTDPIISNFDIMGMTYTKKDEWLLDGINSKGLLGGLLFLYEGTSVTSAEYDYLGVIGLEVLTYLLSICSSIQ